MRVSREFIAYNDLEKNIIDSGFCILCGSCEAACPIQAIKVEEGAAHSIYDCSEYVEFCPICYDVCPLSEALLLEILGFIIDAPNRRESIGYYRNVVLAQATDPKLRELTHGGGVATALLLHAIKTDFINSAVTSESEKKAPINFVPDDLLSTIEYKYFSPSVAKAFSKAVCEYGKVKIGFVGTPCHIRALRKLEAWEHKIIDRLKIIIGLVCLWRFSFPELTNYLRETHRVEAKDIHGIDLDNRYRILTKSGREITVTVPELKAYTLDVCKMCRDFTCELADISIGGAHPLQDWSIVIMRTKVGEQLFMDALEANILRVRDIKEEPNVFTHFVEMALLKRRLANEEIERRMAEGKPIPPAFTRFLELLPREASLLKSLTADQIMTSEVMTISSETKVREVLAVMTEHHHMGYPIVDKKGELVGIVTFEDIAKVPASEREKVCVGEIARKKLITVYPDDSVMSVYEAMERHKIGRVLIVDRENPRKLLGIVTKTDILHSLRWPMRLR